VTDEGKVTIINESGILSRSQYTYRKDGRREIEKPREKPNVLQHSDAIGCTVPSFKSLGN
jgi:hypothetical protein